MSAPTRPGRFNVRLILGIAVFVAILAAGAVGVRKWQQERMIEQALVNGQAAYERGDWREAGRLLGRYVRRHLDQLDDPEIAAVCRQYAQAELAVQPLAHDRVRNAIGIYQRLLRDAPFDSRVCAQLAVLYQATGNAAQLEYVADQLADRQPDDPKPYIWRARAELIRLDAKAARRELEALLAVLGENGPADYYIDACLMLASIAEDPEEAGDWIDKALAKDGDSAQALCARASHLRRTARMRPAEREASMETALEHLTRVEGMPQLSPTTRQALCAELIAHGQFDRAATQIAALKQVTREELADAYLDTTDWRVDIELQAATIALARGNPDRAAEQLAALLEDLKQNHHRVRVLAPAAEAAVAAAKLEQARRWADEYVALTRGVGGDVSPQGAYLRALLADAEGEPYDVIDHLEPLRTRDGFSDRMRSLLAEAYRKTGQPGRVAELYAGRVPNSDQPLRDALGAIEALLRRDNVAAALETLRDLTQRFPDNPALQLLRIQAELASMANRDDERARRVRVRCETELRELSSVHPDNLDIRSQLAALLARTDRVDEAEQVLEQARRELSDNPAAALQLAGFYEDRDRDEDAAAAYESAVEIFPDHPEVWLARAAFAQRAGRLAEARASLASGMDAVPEDGRPELERRLAYYQVLEEETRDQGIKGLERLASNDPDDITSRELLLDLPAIRRDRERAEKLIAEIKAVEGATGLRWRIHEAQLLFDQLVDENAPEGAESAGQEITPDPAELCDRIHETLTPCIAADPTVSRPVLLLGQTYERTGDPGEAERLYRRALERWPTLPVGDRLLQLLMRERRFDEAFALMDRHASLFRRSEFANRRMTAALESGDFDRFSEEVERAASQHPDDPALLLASARVTYQRTRDPRQAEPLLERAEQAGADPVSIAATRVAILRAEGDNAAARACLDDLIARNNSFAARLLRARFLDALGETELAEAEYQALPELASDESGYAALGQFYAQQGRFTDSITASEAGLEQYPASLALKSGLLKAMLTRNGEGDIERTLEILDDMPEANRDTDLLWIEAVALNQKSDPDSRSRLQSVLERAAKQGDASIEAFRGLVRIAVRVDCGTADRILSTAVRQHGAAHPELLTTQARVRICRGEAAQALALLRQAVTEDQQTRNPEVFELVLSIADALENREALRSFERPLERLVERNPGDEHLQLIRAQLVSYNNRTAAISHLEKYLEQSETNPGLPALLTLATLHQRAGKFEVAGSYLDRAAAISPDSLQLLAARANWLEAQGRYDELHDVVEGVLDRNAGNPIAEQVHTRAARALGASGEAKHVAQALDLYRGLIERDQNAVAPRLAVALLQYQQGRLDEAERTYRSVLEIDPERGEALNNLAWMLSAHDGDHEAALEFAERAVVQQPNDPEYRDTLGQILTQLPGRLADAREHFQKAAELSQPGSLKRARALLKLARVCAELDEHEQARRWLQAAQTIDDALRRGQRGEALSDAEHEELLELLEGAQTPP